MIAILSPSKTLDTNPSKDFTKHTVPDFLDQSEILVAKLKKMSVGQLSKLMGISTKLAEENRARYQLWNLPFNTTNAKPAALTFKGEVYEGLDVSQLKAKEWGFAQKQLRIVSGLYGLLRPLDLIQPYRLEMGTKLATRRGKNLYAFWEDRITTAISEAVGSSQGNHVLLNLASHEYFKAVGSKQLDVPVISAAFKEKQGGSLKMITFFVKKARGMLARFMIQNQITKVNDLKDFREDGYRFNAKLSDGEQLLFTRGK